jgi:DNA-binding Lrp family transcriptional regulator
MGIYIDDDVMRHPAIGWPDKVIVADVLSFTKRGMPYYKSNAVIADELQLSERNVSRIVNTLAKANILECTFNGRKRNIAVIGLEGSQIGEDSQSVYGSQVGYGSQTGEAASPNRRGRVAKLAKQSSQVGERIELSNTYYLLVLSKREEFGWSDAFGNAWEEWMTDRKNRKIRKYTELGMTKALTSLWKKSGGNEQVAIQIINQSIENGWQGFWPIKARQPKGFNAANFSIEGMHDFIDEG